MANIMITEACNLKCPYCFADEFTNKKGQPVRKMTVEDFKTAVDFVLTAEGERIGVIGGEPTLHPDFKEMVEYLINNDKVATFTVFTNGIHLDRYYNLFASSKAGMLVNCNSPLDIGEERFNRLRQNLDVLIKDMYMKNRISLGINMYKPDFDYDYMVELLTRYDMPHVRTSIVVPKKENTGDFLEYFLRMKPRVFEFFKVLEQKGIMPTYDCNLMPACVTTKEEKEWLKDTFWNMEKKSQKYCNLIDDSKCNPVIDILPDLNAVRCFGMSQEWKVPIKDFKALSELRDYFFNKFDVFSYSVSGSERCRTCKERERMKCIGGCLLFKIERIKKAREFCSNL